MTPWHPIRLLFGALIFLGAFLLFQLQPIIGKHILPWFGSSASLWSACLMFFQLSLLAGYLYAHGLHQVSLRVQAIVHALLAAGSLALISWQAFRWGSPLTPSLAWAPPSGEQPVQNILTVLLLAVGVPFFLLAANSSLMQAWFVHLRRRECPYAFYAVSNAGSLLGLLTYPFFFERIANTQGQGWIWGAGYAVFVAASLLVAALTATRGRRPAGGRDTGPARAAETADAVRPPPGAREGFLWFTLALCASTLLVSTSNLVCQDIAPVPLLWVLPLSLYLLSFVVGFSRLSDRSLDALVLLGAAGLLSALWMLYTPQAPGILTQVALYNFALFSIALFCHGTLYHRRPASAYLTRFYLLVATGGAAGGVFVNLAAPLLFPGFWEYPLALLLGAGLLTFFCFAGRDHWLFDFRWVAALLPVAVVWIGALDIREDLKDVAHVSRNFYGTLRVRAEFRGEGPLRTARYSLMHGSIVHGFQFSRTKYRYMPTAYFAEGSGVGRAIRSHPRYESDQPFRMGVVGLGIGTLAAYGRDKDYIRFYELDPAVVELARNTNFFTYVSDSPAGIDYKIGDGRLALERELESNGPMSYSILVLDAFSGDAIPIHLITREAFGLYLQHLAPGGIIAANGTNRHVDLTPLGKAIADHFGLAYRVVLYKGDGKATMDSTWLLFSPDEEALNRPLLANALQLDTSKIEPVPLWTDQYSHLFGLMHNRPFQKIP